MKRNDPKVKESIFYLPLVGSLPTLLPHFRVGVLSSGPLQWSWEERGRRPSHHSPLLAPTDGVRENNFSRPPVDHSTTNCRKLLDLLFQEVLNDGPLKQKNIYLWGPVLFVIFSQLTFAFIVVYKLSTRSSGARCSGRRAYYRPFTHPGFRKKGGPLSRVSLVYPRLSSHLGPIA